MDQPINISCQTAAHLFASGLYLYCARKHMGKCSTLGVIGATALQIVHTDKPNVKDRALCSGVAFLPIIAFGLLGSLTGIKVSALSMAYFTGAYASIHLCEYQFPAFCEL